MNYRDDPDDPTDRTVLCAELPTDVGSGLWEADDDAVQQAVLEARRLIRGRDSARRRGQG